jgi:hypothetical protein
VLGATDGERGADEDEAVVVEPDEIEDAAELGREGWGE